MQNISDRVIKFRTWDKELKEFSEWSNRDPYFSTSSGEIFYWERVWNKENGSYDGDIILRDNESRFILQQFTGLKDKNGKDIYEGDLVNFSVKGCPHGPEQEDYEKREVWFDLNSTAFLFDKFYYDGWHGYPVWDIKDIEVVGNIFENKK